MLAAMTRADDVRVAADRDMAERLAQHPSVRSVSRARGRAAGGTEIERSLLSTAVRLTDSVAPELVKMLADCAEILDVETKLEPFVYPSATMNAAVTPPEEGKLFVLFSSELLDAFDHDELCFVVGHELGHHKYDHHEIPVRAVLEESGGADPELALSLFSWSRFAELSADRAGLLCCRNLEAVGRCLFKLASGLRGTRGNVAVEALLQQVATLRAQGIATADEPDRDEWFSTHPFSPLRLEAAALAHAAGLLRGASPSQMNWSARPWSLMGLGSWSEGEDGRGTRDAAGALRVAFWWPRRTNRRRGGRCPGWPAARDRARQAQRGGAARRPPASSEDLRAMVGGGRRRRDPDICMIARMVMWHREMGGHRGHCEGLRSPRRSRPSDATWLTEPRSGSEMISAML